MSARTCIPVESSCSTADHASIVAREVRNGAIRDRLTCSLGLRVSASFRTIGFARGWCSARGVAAPPSRPPQRPFSCSWGNTPSRSTVHSDMKLLLSALVLALVIGFALPATNAYAWWCGPNRWCGPGPRVGVYVAPGVGFWWGRSWYPYRWRPGWNVGWRADPRRNWCDWHRC
jgi:hypothetical protein